TRHRHHRVVAARHPVEARRLGVLRGTQDLLAADIAFPGTDARRDLLDRRQAQTEPGSGHRPQLPAAWRASQTDRQAAQRRTPAPREGTAGPARSGIRYAGSEKTRLSEWTSRKRTAR